MISNIRNNINNHDLTVEKRAGLKISTALSEYMNDTRSGAGEANRTGSDDYHEKVSNNGKKISSNVMEALGTGKDMPTSTHENRSLIPS